MSDKNDKKRKICPTKLDVSDNFVLNRKICPTRVRQKCKDMSDRTRCVDTIDPIHAAAMTDKKRGLGCRFARQYVNCDVTSLLLHVPVT